MTYITELFNNVLVPILTVLAIPVIIVTIILVIVRMTSGKGGAWKIILLPIALYVAVGILWLVLNLLTGAL